MARPVKKSPQQWKQEILDTAQALFLSKGYEETSIADIMETVGGAKGLFYRFFESKEALMSAIGDKLFFENNPFETVKERSDLNGLQKMQTLLTLNQGDTTRAKLNVQAVPILKNPRILVEAITSNQRILTPLWLALLEEAKADGSIQSEYTKELSELLPLINFWLMPSIYPATTEELQHKFQFIVEVLTKMGLPIFSTEAIVQSERLLENLSAEK